MNGKCSTIHNLFQFFKCSRVFLHLNQNTTKICPISFRKHCEKRKEYRLLTSVIKMKILLAPPSCTALAISNSRSNVPRANFLTRCSLTNSILHCPRLFDLYIILLKQHLERMNDWLVRAESRMQLDDDVERTYEGVQAQVTNHQVWKRP